MALLASPPVKFFQDETVFFDGDQKYIPTPYDWRRFEVENLSIRFLSDKIKEQTGEIIKFSVDSHGNSGNASQQIELLKKYLDYYLNKVFYLPKKTPEEIIWNDELAENTVRFILNQAIYQEYSNEINVANSFKDKFSIYTKYASGSNNSGDILSTQKTFIQKWINDKNADYRAICEVLESLK